MKKYTLLLLFFFFSAAISAQLSAGDIAFLGFNTDTQEGYSFVVLKDIPGSEKIYFTERGVINSSTWNVPEESTYLFTAPGGGISCGSIVTLTETTPNVLIIEGVSGATMVLQVGSFNLGSGDQILAYQYPTGLAPTPGDATFLAGLMSDYQAGCIDGTTTWSVESCTNSTSESVLPPGLTNGIDAISMTPTGPEKDNFRYIGSLTGTAASVRASINNFNNWENNDGPTYDLTAASYLPVDITCSALPVELVNFDVKVMNDKHVKLAWSTASEINHDYFTIQRSLLGHEWKDVKHIDEADYSQGLINFYETLDYSPYVGNMFYRLKQTDYDGLFSYSEVRRVKISEEIDVKIYPNPTVDKIIVSFGNEEPLQIEIFDNLGNSLTSKVLMREINRYNLEIDLSNLPDGFYFIGVDNSFQKLYKGK